MENKGGVSTLDRFTNLCRQHKLRVTPQRTAVFKAVIHSSEHPSAEHIHHGLLKDYPNLSFDTVYRTLNTFVEIGIIQVVEGYGKSRRFDPNLEQHHHLHCLKCGAIIDFISEVYDNLEIPDRINEKFDVQSKRVVLNGICELCRSARTGA